GGARALGGWPGRLARGGALAFGRQGLPAGPVLGHETRIEWKRRQIRALDRRISDELPGKGFRRQRRKLDVAFGTGKRPAIRVDGERDRAGILELRLLARRPGLDRRELLPHRIDAEIKPRGAQRRIHVRCRKAEPAHRSEWRVALAIRPCRRGGRGTGEPRGSFIAGTGRAERRRHLGIRLAPRERLLVRVLLVRAGLEAIALARDTIE